MIWSHQLLKEFFNEFTVTPDWALCSGKAVLVTLKTLPELEAFWRKYQSSLPYSVTAYNCLAGQEFLRPFEWVFASSETELVKALTRWDQSDMFVKWRPWAEDNLANAELAAVTPASVMLRGWWVLVNYPALGDEFCWEAPDIGMVDDLGITPEDMAQQFQEELFASWRANDSDLMAFTPEELDLYLVEWSERKRDGREYYGHRNEKMPAPLVM